LGEAEEKTSATQVQKMKRHKGRGKMLSTEKPVPPYCPIRATILIPDGHSAFDYEWFDNKTGEHSSCSVKRRKGWRNNEAR
jgi:hypothetical protein